LNRAQWLSRDALLSLQRDKLQQVIDYAYQYVPYYQRMFDAAGFHPVELRKDINSLCKLPILTKAIIRENLNDLLTTEPQRRQQLRTLATSGSTGEPLTFMRDHNFRDYVTAGIQRHIGWAGCDIGDAQAHIWGVPPGSTFTQTLRARLARWVWNSYSTNGVLLTEEMMQDLIEHIRRRRPRILFGYASSVHKFAQFAREKGYDDLTFRGVFTTAERLLPSVREDIEQVFGCKVFNRYATLELGDIACDCEEHTGLHVSLENNYVEILRDGQPADPGEVGDIIVTNLNNLGMPFIRYNIGDLGTWDRGGACPCGRAAPMLESLEGRTVDMFQTRDGRQVWGGFAGATYRCMTHTSIKQFQVVQQSLDSVLVRLVEDGEIPQSTLQEIARTLQNLLGDTVEVKFEFMDEIPTLSSGKHRYAVSELNR
jgi:phenylacetate-CoA ligase